MNTFKKHYINILYYSDIRLQNKRINCSPRVCFHDHHPEAVLNTTVSNLRCRPRKAHNSKHNKKNNKSHQMGKKTSSTSQTRFQTFTNSSRYTNTHLQPHTNEPPTSQPNALSIIISDTNFTDISLYVYVYTSSVYTIYPRPPMASEPPCCRKRRPQKGCMQEEYSVHLFRATTGQISLLKTIWKELKSQLLYRDYVLNSYLSAFSVLLFPLN